MYLTITPFLCILSRKLYDNAKHGVGLECRRFPWRGGVRASPSQNVGAGYLFERAFWNQFTERARSTPSISKLELDFPTIHSIRFWGRSSLFYSLYNRCPGNFLSRSRPPGFIDASLVNLGLFITICTEVC